MPRDLPLIAAALLILAAAPILTRAPANVAAAVIQAQEMQR